MDLIFCGTPKFAVPTLELLVKEGFRVRLVVTQPDRPRGRGMEVTHPQVKQSALVHGLPIVQPEKIKTNAEFRAQLEAIAPQAIVVVGYGRIIPPWMLDLPPLGNINLHASLLPKYRGAAPIQWAIANGETVTGNTTIRLDSGLDTGDILLQEETAIMPDDDAVTLAPRLAQSGAALTVKTLRGLEDGSIRPVKQDASHSSLAPILQKEDGRILSSRTATDIFNRLRGFQPWPGAFTTFRGKNLSLVAAKPYPTQSGLSLSPGELLYKDERLFLGCAEKSILEIKELQLEGKKRMSARDFANGYKPVLHEKLGTSAEPVR
ncbi:MAG: methionyl-tRNA formyltransferase [Acidobacteriaceae bacterium]|nr:methionyl-tRNA formyltransferase [Acidobacteriaceae bacterium]